MSSHREAGKLSRRAVLAAGLGVAASSGVPDIQGRSHKRRKPKSGLTRTSTASKPDVVSFLMEDMRTDDWPILAKTQALIGGTWFSNFGFNVAVCGASRATPRRRAVPRLPPSSHERNTPWRTR